MPGFFLLEEKKQHFFGLPPSRNTPNDEKCVSKTGISVLISDLEPVLQQEKRGDNTPRHGWCGDKSCESVVKPFVAIPVLERIGRLGHSRFTWLP